MRKVGFLSTVLVLPLALFCGFVVKAKTNVGSIYNVQLGMNMADVLVGLQGKYSVHSSDLDGGLRVYMFTGGLDLRYSYEIYTLNGKVASIWTDDVNSYSGETVAVGDELFDALYAAGQPRHDKVGEAMGVRDLQVSVELQKPTFDSSSRTLIFSLPTGEDFRLEFINAAGGTPSLEIKRVRSLDEEGMQRLSATP